MLADLLTRPCTITRRTTSGADEYGDDVTVPTTVTTVCELQQRARRADNEPDQAGEFSDTEWLLVLPAGTIIGTGDSVQVDGHGFEMYGDPWAVRNPRTGADSHVEATLRRTAGAGSTS